MGHMNEISLFSIDTLSISKSLFGTQMTWIKGYPSGNREKDNPARLSTEI